MNKSQENLQDQISWEYDCSYTSKQVRRQTALDASSTVPTESPHILAYTKFMQLTTIIWCNTHPKNINKFSPQPIENWKTLSLNSPHRISLTLWRTQWWHNLYLSENVPSVSIDVSIFWNWSIFAINQNNDHYFSCLKMRSIFFPLNVGNILVEKA